MRVLVFGDSITQGYWAIEHGWVDRVRMHYDALQLEDLNGRDEPTIFNLGISADNTEDILKRIEQEVAARTRPNHRVKSAVLLQIGINDSSKEPTDPQVSVSQYEENLKEIITRIKPKTSKIILIGSSSCTESQTTPVSWGEHYYTNASIKTYETVMQEIAAEYGVGFIPVFEQFKAEVDSGKNLLADGLHPNEAGHELIYKIVMPKLQELLK